MSEEKDLRDEMKRLKEEMQALKQQLHDTITQSSDLERKRRGIHIDINDHLAGISDYVADVMEGVNEGIRGELEKSIFIHPHRGEVIIHRNHEHHRSPEHIEKPDLTRAANIMSALGQEHRLKILSELMTGGKYISDFQTSLPEITASTLSSHLGVLQEAGLVVQERVRGRYLITIPGRIAYKMAAAVARQREKPHDFGYTCRTEHDDDNEDEDEDGKTEEDEDDDHESEEEE
jgi:DNA-binding HxlR family transcriptional regulator